MSEDFKKMFKDRLEIFKSWLKADPRRAMLVGAAGFVLFIGAVFSIGGAREKKRVVVSAPTYENAQIMENPYKRIYRDKLKLLDATRKSMARDKLEMSRELQALRGELEGLKTESRKSSEAEPPAQTEKSDTKGPKQIPITPGDSSLKGGIFGKGNERQPSVAKKPRTHKARNSGVITFPVKLKENPEPTGIPVPAGSFAHATILSGAKVPHGKTKPLLVALDSEFVAPNGREFDLSGCFVIVKSESDFGTEVVEGQPDEIRCFGDAGVYYKQSSLKGWLSDGKSNNLGISGKLNSNQGKVAKWAFTNSAIDGLRKALERNARSIGGRGVDTEASKVIVQNGAGDTLDMVAKWYLKFVQNLTPNILVNSGQKAIVVLGSDLLLPNDYFEKREGGEDAIRDLMVPIIE